MRLFFRKKNADERPNEKRVKHKRRRTVLAQDGLAAACVGAMIVFNATARGINLLLALGSFFIGFLVLDWIWGRRTLRGLRARRRVPDAIYAAEPFYVEIELDATKRRSTSYAVVVEDQWEPEDERFAAPSELKKRIDAELKKERKARRRKLNRRIGERLNPALEGTETLKPVVYFPSIESGEKLRARYVGVFPRRGRVRMKKLTISTRFPLGFFRSAEAFEAPEETIVLPRIGALLDERTAFGFDESRETEIAERATSAIPDETAAIRDWRVGDPKRAIAWRATARRGRLQAREYAKRRARSLMLILDLFDAAPNANADKAARWKATERAISFVATLIERGASGEAARVFVAINADADGVPASDDWSEIVGGASSLAALKRLAVAVAPERDRLAALLGSAVVRNERDAQTLVVSPSRIDPTRIGPDGAAARFLDASSEEFDAIFRITREEESDAE